MTTPAATAVLLVLACVQHVSGWTQGLGRATGAGTTLQCRPRGRIHYQRVGRLSWPCNRPAGRVTLRARPQTVVDPSTAQQNREQSTEALPPVIPDAATASETSATGDLDPKYFFNLGILLIITLMWALNTPVVRYMYTTVEHGPPVWIMNAGAALSALTTVLLIGAVKRDEFKTHLLEDKIAIRGGAELGLYKLLGLGFHYLGTSLTLSSQAAFFTQLTTVMVPVAQSVLGVKISPRIWAAAVLALGGIALLAEDGGAAMQGANLQNLIKGDLFCALAALFYSAYDIRVNVWGSQTATVPLTIWKTAFQTLYAFAVLGAVSQLGLPQSTEILDWFKQVQPQELGLILGAMAFSGAFANGIATLLQIGAQDYVGPSRAQLIYATSPLWNTCIAVAFLKEKVGTLGYIGGSLFFVALTIAALSPPETEQERG